MRLGAKRIEIGQSASPERTWVVMVDPEGKQFCVLPQTKPANSNSDQASFGKALSKAQRSMSSRFIG